MKVKIKNKKLKIVFFLCLAFAVFAILAFAITSVVFKNPDNCIKCHYMRPFYDTWKSSAHAGSGCLTCHDYGPTRMIGNQLKYLAGTYNPKPRTIVPRLVCIAEGCHDERLVDPVVKYSRRGIFFSHTHATEVRRDIIKLRCRSCHVSVGHSKGKSVAKEVCFICHFINTGDLQKAVTGCPSCHPSPKGDILHDGKRFSHEAALRKGRVCRDCHVKIVKGRGEVPRERCHLCHVDRFDKYGDKALIHKKHVEDLQIYCLYCHEKIEHGKIEVSH